MARRRMRGGGTPTYNPEDPIGSLAGGPGGGGFGAQPDLGGAGGGAGGGIYISNVNTAIAQAIAESGPGSASQDAGVSVGTGMMMTGPIMMMTTIMQMGAPMQMARRR